MTQSSESRKVKVIIYHLLIIQHLMSDIPSATPPPPKPCCICGATDSCITIRSLSGNQHFCLLHYYTTGAEKNKKKSLLVDNRTIHQQLPQVQEIFAEAFTELQTEIREESARAFKTAASSDDPLAELLDGNSTTQPRKPSFNYARSKKKFKEGRPSDGGFLRK